MIVPRVPGGQILLEKLIVLGEVARKYGLYTKITGAQRIDLYAQRGGAAAHHSGELVDAGFESAMPTARRRARSIQVGRPWCRTASRIR